ncbi:hypothetical protein QE400_003182 [Xanthomonas sacchari]|nr:hypothetical protein [Xanthomonas sacchari]
MSAHDSPQLDVFSTGPGLDHRLGVVPDRTGSRRGSAAWCKW